MEAKIKTLIVENFKNNNNQHREEAGGNRTIIDN